MGVSSSEPKPTIRFSMQEILHLLASVLLLTVAATAALGGRAFPQNLNFRLEVVLASLAAVATGFLLHELAHKVMAQRLGYWAEFRAKFGWLAGSVVFSVLAGMLAAVPGAVMIRGAVGRQENGLISLVGPATNVVLAGVAWALVSVLGFGAALVAFVNALLAVFNLIPFGNFDGAKIKRWSLGIYLGTLAAALAMAVGIYLTSGHLLVQA